jgi:PAS domain-containing protein
MKRDKVQQIVPNTRSKRWRLTNWSAVPCRFCFTKADREHAPRNKLFCLEHLGQTRSWELRKLRKDGEALWVRETARAMLVKNRPVVVVVSEDITDGKRAAEALREVQAELTHANRVAALGQLTASIVHEVSQPVAGALSSGHAALRWLDRPDLEAATNPMRIPAAISEPQPFSCFLQDLGAPLQCGDFLRVEMWRECRHHAAHAQHAR